MRTNVRIKEQPNYTFEGGVAQKLDAEGTLRRLVMANMLWEDQFYIDGKSTAGLIKELVPQCRAEFVAACAYHARTAMKLRHVPLLLVREMTRYSSHKHLVDDLLPDVIQRPDEITEFLSIYWQDGKHALPNSVKRGLATAMRKFNEYQFAKYDRKGKGVVRLRDALFLTHPAPVDIDGKKAKQHPCKYNGGATTVLRHSDTLFARMAQDTLQTPDTWEVRLSAGEDKRAVFEELMREKKLGALAFLRNLRNMVQAGVNYTLMHDYAAGLDVERVLPFRFITAARYAPFMEPTLETLMFKCLKDMPKLPGTTVLMIDSSSSMDSGISSKSELNRFDAACALAILLREICEDVQIYAFNTSATQIIPRRGFALRDQLKQHGPAGGTELGHAMTQIHHSVPYDRCIVLTDEQSRSTVPQPLFGTHGYIINVAAYKNGIRATGWHHIDGWSEAVIDYIQALENME